MLITSKRLKKHIYHDTNMLGHYLAGLWEGDGNTNIKDKNSPKTTLHITVHRQQAPFIKKLLNLLRRLCDDPVGSMHVRQDNNSCVLNIYTPRGLNFTIDLLHSKLRTPKAYRLNEVIKWLNTNHGAKLTYISNTSSLKLGTSWFAGFVDADGCFSIDFRQKPRFKVSCQFQLNQRMVDPRSNLGYSSIFNEIAKELGVNLHRIKQKNGVHYYVIKATSRKSKQILRQYFDTHPLLTSKALDYRVWCAVDDLLKRKYINYVEQIQEYKKSMNNGRRKFTWYHLRQL